MILFMAHMALTNCLHGEWMVEMTKLAPDECSVTVVGCVFEEAFLLLSFFFLSSLI